MDEQIKENITNLISSNKVLLFMKGTKENPECGFSYKVVDTLKHIGVEFDTYNILENDEMRQAIKEYANWPTYPQLWVNGKLVGGCDIILQMADSGELQKLLKSS
jgi:monothiol glutaredoxin